MNNSEIPETEAITYVICVSHLDRTQLPKRRYKNSYMAIKGTEADALAIQQKVASVGFKSEDGRVFPDDIESITYKVHNNEITS